MNKYAHLLSPIKIGGQQFKNRIFHSPTGVSIDPERYCIGYYERKAIGGAASVCVGDGITLKQNGFHFYLLIYGPLVQRGLRP